MKIRSISLLLAIIILCSMFSLNVSAEALPDTSHSHTWSDTFLSYDGTVDGFPVKVDVKQCSDCALYSHVLSVCGLTYSYNSYQLIPSFSDVLRNVASRLLASAFSLRMKAEAFLKDSDKKDTPPSGYTSDGVPSVNSAGLLTWQPTLPDDLVFNFRYDSLSTYPIINNDGSSSPTTNIIKSSNHALLRIFPKQNSEFFGFRNIYIYQPVYDSIVFTAPISGYYSSNSIKSVSSSYGSTTSKDWSDITYYWNIRSSFYQKGDNITLSVGYLTPNVSVAFKKVIAEFYTPVFTIEPYESAVTKLTNIIINNNNWSGSIYLDTTNNLTYIYPQYTTINENNEIITNISENPIIYNSETNQYYTYDSVTNNYYYITYEQPSTPSPTPSTSPDPGASPTPTPAPGGDSGSTSGLMEMLQAIKDSIVQGFADLTANIKLSIENLNINIKNYFDKKLPDQSTPETAQPTPTPAPSVSPEPSVAPSAAPSPSGSPDASPSPLPDSGTPTPAPSGGSSNISGGDDEGLFGWLWDLLKDLIKSILKKIFGLLSSLLGFLIWCVERVTLLVPFLPGPAVAALSAGVVLIFVIKLIRFIRG